VGDVSASTTNRRVMFNHNFDEMSDALVASGAVSEDKKETARNALIGCWADKIAIIWTVEDVLGVCPNLSQEEAVNVLQSLLHNHDASLGVNWETIHGIAIYLSYNPGEPTDEWEEPEDS
jgi:predicted transcriptional regulator